MRFLGRKADVDPLVPVDICAQDDACDLDRRYAEGHLVETLDGRESEVLDDLIDITRSWEVYGQEASHQIRVRRRSIELGDVASSSAQDRSGRRALDRSRETYMRGEIAQAHNNAVAEIQDRLHPFWRANILTDETPVLSMMRGHMTLLHRRDKKAERKGATRDALQHSMVKTFEYEYFARLHMKYLNDTNPEILQTVFDPMTLRDLPASMQRLAAVDIGRGREGSILLDNAAKQLDHDESAAEKLAEYIRANNLPESVKRTLISINMGARLMGAPTCPFNDLGICTHMLARLPQADLPEELRRDIEQREKKTVQDRTGRLSAFANNVAMSRLLDSAYLFNASASPAQQSHAKKRRITYVPFEQRDVSSIEQFETEDLPFSRIVVRVVGDEGDGMHLDAKAAHDSKGSQIAELKDSKMVSKFLDGQHSQKLDDAMGAALLDILTRPHYLQSERSITPWLDMRQKAFTNPDDVHEKYYRYSMRRAQGISAGPIGDQTRIIFSQAVQNDVRYVTIHKIAKKADMKSNPTLRRS